MEIIPPETRLRMADLASNKQRKGIVGLSENSIRNLIKANKFPKPYAYEGVRGKYFIYGEILEWLNKQKENEKAQEVRNV